MRRYFINNRSTVKISLADNSKVVYAQAVKSDWEQQFDRKWHSRGANQFRVYYRGI